MANDANIIKIKRSGTSGAPASLKLGELAYSYLAASGNPTSNGGDRLFIGANGVNVGSGNANDVIVIGGKYFTDMLDHERGVLTASSALVVDANKKLDELLVDNLSLNGNTVSSASGAMVLSAFNNIIQLASSNFIAGGAFDGSQVGLTDTTADLKQLRSGSVNLVVGASGTATNTVTLNNNGILTVPGTINTLSNGNLTLSPNGSGLVSIAGAYTLPRIDGVTGYALITNGSGTASWQQISTTLNIAGTTGTDGVSLTSETLAFAGATTPITIAVTNNTVTVAVADATASTKGLASFDATDFTVTSGAVTVNAERVQDIVGAMVSGTETDLAATYDDTAGTLDFTLATVNTNVGTFGSTTSIPVITVNGKGLVTGVTTASISTTLNIAGTTGTDSVSLGSDTLTFAGSGAISTAVTNNQVAISVATATSSVLGVASFNTASFTVSSGDVTIKSAGVTNTQLVNSSFFIGTTSISLGDASGTTSSLGVNISGKAATAGTADKVANALTFAASGGTALNSSFDGTTAKTIDYSSVGAAPKAGSSDIVTVGTLTSGSIGVGFTAIPNIALANSKVTVGTTDINLGASSTTLAGLTQVDVNNIRIAGNTVSSTDSNGDIVFDPNGSGTVNVSNARITNLAEPTGPQDAATKAYVDANRTGLDVKGSVRVATTANIALSNTQTIDDVALAVGDRVLVKNQTTGSENGIYVVATGAWTRSEDADNTPTGEVSSGMFTFVEEGTAYADSGWVLSTDGVITLGTTALSFVQFSGAGQITAGDGLSKTGNTLFVNVANGIEISGDNVQLASSVAGNGLTYTSGVIDVVGTTNRISVSANAIDISASYVGQTSITTLGTISTGVWQGTSIGAIYGGTGQTTYSKGDLLYASASNTLSKLTAGTNGQTLQLQDGVPMWADLDGGSY
jgi:hypothetical protein